MRKKLSLILVILIFVSCLTTTGVFATFKYSYNDVLEREINISLGCNDFVWSGADDLPDSVSGEDHAWLILNLVSGKNSNGQEIGLDNPNSKLNDYINDRLDGGWGWERDYFGCMAVTGGTDVEDLFGTRGAGLSFIIEVKSDTEYYIYTTSIYLGERGEINWLGTSNKTPGKPSIPINEWIYPVYKTKLTRPNKNTNWEIVETIRGRARSDWYDENRSSANATQIPSFDVKTWEPAEMGQAPNETNAIWTFVGDNPTAYATSSMQTVYYRIKPSSARTINVVSSNEKCTITVYSSNGTQIAVSGTSLPKTATFNATANTTYYIGVTGDDVINFEIS